MRRRNAVRRTLLAVTPIFLVALPAALLRLGVLEAPVELATLLFALSLYLHAWVGVRNIVMDYIKSSGLRLALYVIVIAALIVYAGWSVQILWSV